MKIKVKAYVRPHGTGFRGELVAIRRKPVTMFTCHSVSVRQTQKMIDSYASELFAHLDRPTSVRAWTKEWEVADRA